MMVRKLFKIGFILYVFSLTSIPAFIFVGSLAFIKDGYYMKQIVDKVVPLWNEMIVKYNLYEFNSLLKQLIIILPGSLIALLIIGIIFKFNKKSKKAI